MSGVEINAGGVGSCHRCGDAELLLVTRVPHTITGVEGVPVAGTRGVGLCATCDRDDPDAQGVLAFFAVHEAVADDSVDTVAQLLDEWARCVAARVAAGWSGPAEEDHATIDEELRRWRDDDL